MVFYRKKLSSLFLKIFLFFQYPTSINRIRNEVLSAQLKLWRAALPDLINQFRKLPDKRHPASIKHKVTVLMVFGK